MYATFSGGGVAAWTEESVWNRILEAVEIERILPDIARPQQFGNSMPDIVRDWQAYQRTDPPDLVEHATIEQTKRCDEVMGWVRFTSRSEWRAMWLSARGADDRWISRRLHCSPKGVRTLRDNGLRRIAFCLTRGVENA